jgi:hypothetical protein
MGGGAVGWRATTVICLSPDLDDSAKASKLKAQIKSGAVYDEFTGSYDESNIYLVLAGKPIVIPNSCTGSDARIVVIGHGDPGSQFIGDKGWTKVQMDPAQLAEKLRTVLGDRRVGRVALKNCFGGGNRKTRNRRPIGAEQSFAFEFASRAGFADSVTAFNAAVVNDRFVNRKMDDGNLLPPTVEGQISMMDESGTHRPKEQGDKVIFIPRRTACVGHPIDPKVYIAPVKDSASTNATTAPTDEYGVTFK